MIALVLNYDKVKHPELTYEYECTDCVTAGKIIPTMFSIIVHNSYL